jgi:Zn finger protein HypA/HybF involved in hydrogenase expression
VVLGVPHALLSERAVDVGDQVIDLGNGEMIGVPLWALLPVVMLPAAILWGADVRLVRRRRRGLCPSCGYDRRGLAPDANCPECGNVPIK